MEWMEWVLVEMRCSQPMYLFLQHNHLTVLTGTFSCLPLTASLLTADTSFGKTFSTRPVWESTIVKWRMAIITILMSSILAIS